ncbi:tyrosine-type recombinase/integrase [Burkholderia contaminans]|nr:tyrosine-type recombinase/integrase [Burkholderia contaminans]
MKFDANEIRKMPPGTDEAIDGFVGLRIAATIKRRTWIYRYRSPLDGKMKQIKLGEWPALPFAAAIAAWEEQRRVRSSGLDVALNRKLERQRLLEQQLEASRPPYTVRMACTDYYNEHILKARKTKGAELVEYMFDQYLERIENTEVKNLKRAECFDLLQSLSHIPAMATKLRCELNLAWVHAMDAGRIPETTPNWWQNIMRGKLRSKGKRQGGTLRKEKRVLSASELIELFRWFPRCSDLLHDTLTLYLWTGTRGGEICSMEGAEISEESDGWWWTIPKAKTKNHNVDSATDMRVPLVGRAKEIVLARVLRFGDGYLFPNKKGEATNQLIVQTAVYHWQPYSKSRGFHPRLTVTHWSPHDLRRTVRTILASLGCPRDVGEVMLGHVLGGVEGTYNRHTYDRERRYWITKLDTHLEQLAAASSEHPQEHEMKAAA